VNASPTMEQWQAREGDMTERSTPPTQRKSTKPGIAVRDRQLKLQFLYKGEVGTGEERVIRACHFPFSTLAEMAEALGLKEWQLNGKHDRPDNLSHAALDAIAAYFGFIAYREEWLNWSAVQFARYFNEAIACAAPHQSPESQAVKSPRETGVPLVPVYGRQEVGTHRLASLRIEAVLSNDSERWPIKIRLRCRVANGIGIEKGFVDLDCAEAIAPEDEQNFQDAYKVPGTVATIRVHATTESRPSWEVTASTGPLDDVLPDEPWCAVRKLGTGDILTARYVIADKDHSGTEDYICKVDGKPVGRNKKTVLDRIASAAVLHNDDGEIVLCRHSVSFEDAYAGLRQEDGRDDQDNSE